MSATVTAGNLWLLIYLNLSNLTNGFLRPILVEYSTISIRNVFLRVGSEAISAPGHAEIVTFSFVHITCRCI